MTGRIKTRNKVLETWLRGAGITQTQLAKELAIDDGNFSKMVNNEIEPSKTFMKKLAMRTGYSFDALFELDRNAISDDTDK